MFLRVHIALLIDLPFTPDSDDTRVSESDAYSFSITTVLLSCMWCSQWVSYVEDIRYTVRVLVHITVLVLKHDVAEAHTRRVKKVSRSMLYLFALAHPSSSQAYD